MPRTPKTPEERAAIKAQLNFSVDTRETLVSTLNKMLKRGATPSDVQAFWFRLILLDPIRWEPLFKVWCTKTEPQVAAAPVVPSPFG